MAASNKPPERQRLEIGKAKEMRLGHAWSWFEYHAAQRIQTMRFYFLVMAAVIAAYIASENSGNHVAAMAICMLTWLTSYLFFKLDQRNRELVNVGEGALRIAEEELATLLGDQKIRLVKEAEKNDSGMTYRAIFGWFFCLAFFGAAVGFGSSLYQLLCRSGALW